MPIRIYDISRKLGLDKIVVLAKAKELGIARAKVPSSSLDKITGEYLEKELRKAFPNAPVKIPASEVRTVKTESKLCNPSSPSAMVARHSAPPPPFVPLKFRGLTHDDIVFRVLLQRQESRASLTFTALERSIPKELLKSIEPDWRSYIRDEGIEFDSAFQKAVRKHLPGIYYVVMAAEFLRKITFHAALLFFLQPEAQEYTLPSTSENEIFELADFLAQEVRRRAAEQTSQTQKQVIDREIATTPKQPAEVESDQSHYTAGKAPAQKSTRVVQSRRCAFCRQRFPASDMWGHVDREHLNPSHLGGAAAQAVSPTVSLADSRHPNTCAPVEHLVVPNDSRFDRFRGNRCIGCGKTPIPGDFYCYYCAPK